MNSKQTAVDWLIKSLEKHEHDFETGFTSLDDYIINVKWIKDQAKVNEKEQMRLIYEGVLQNVDTSVKQSDLPTFEQYYNETYINKDDKQPRVSDDFQIGPDGAYEHNSDWDATLMDGLEYESWDELYDDYVGESDLHEFIKWIKKHFHVPVKL